ncbi:MAG: HXXEE domain-containing protein, partial [Candidatus Methanofastidiosia archaeon]
MVSKKLDKNLKLAVFSLIVVQAIHSIEEYIYRFYEFFPIFKVYQKIFQIQNIDQAMFFAFNTVLILFLFIVFVIATSKRGNLYFVTGFAIIELLNGIYHFLWTVLTQEYFPGTIS